MINEIITLLREKSDFFIALLWEHLWICAITILIAGILGLFLGILISEKRKLSGPILGTTNILYTIPSISLLGLLIPLTGIGNVTAIIALTVYALLPMVRNTYAGLTGVDPDILEAAKGMGSTRGQVLRKIKLPLALPIIMAGLKNMAVMTIALAGIASFIGAGGLGVAIYRGITTNNMAMTVIGSLLIAILAFGADLLFTLLEKLSRRRLAIMVTLLAVAVAISSLYGLSFQKDKTIKIATKPMTEQFILGEMLKLVIEENTDVKVELTKGIGGGTANIHPALIKGDFDLYPEYTGTAWSYVLKKDPLADEEELFKQLVEEYSSQFQLDWVGLYGFNNTYGLVVRQEIAEEHQLKTYSDLAAVSSQLRFGAEYDFFEREDGFDALARTYGFNFLKKVDMDIGLKYNAITNDQIDVMNVFTTDGQLSVAPVTLLEDDKQFYPNYYCGTIVRQDTLEKYPELKAALLKMDQLITNEEMAKMNYQVESEKRNEQEVAREFLQSKGVIP